MSELVRVPGLLQPGAVITIGAASNLLRFEELAGRLVEPALASVEANGTPQDNLHRQLWNGRMSLLTLLSTSAISARGVREVTLSVMSNPQQRLKSVRGDGWRMEGANRKVDDNDPYIGLSLRGLVGAARPGSERMVGAQLWFKPAALRRVRDLGDAVHRYTTELRIDPPDFVQPDAPPLPAVGLELVESTVLDWIAAGRPAV